MQAEFASDLEHPFHLFNAVTCHIGFETVGRNTSTILLSSKICTSAIFVRTFILIYYLPLPPFSPSLPLCP